jgi:hypothetical protein
MYAYAHLTFFGVLENANVSTHFFEEDKLCQKMARYMYLNGQYQFLSHWMLAICAECAFIYHNVLHLSLESYWEPLTKLNVKFKDLNKFESDAISLIVSGLPDVDETVVVFRTDAKCWTKCFNYAKFDVRERRRFGTCYETQSDGAFINSSTYDALKMTMKLYLFPFCADDETDESTKLVCQRMLNSKFELTSVT